MKVLLVNCSPHGRGTTYVALQEVEKTLNQEGITTDIFQVGPEPIAGCIGCGFCRTHEQECMRNDIVNEFTKISKGYDGYVFGTSVHYAAATGAATSFLDRAFFSGSSNMAYKPGAAVVVCRRGGATATFDQINKYFTINNMLIVGSNYWNMVHALTKDEINKDPEGLQTMRNLGLNMSWVLKNLEAGKKAGIPLPKAEPKTMTLFAGK